MIIFYLNYSMALTSFYELCVPITHSFKNLVDRQTITGLVLTMNLLLIMIKLLIVFLSVFFSLKLMSIVDFVNKSIFYN